MEPKIHTQCNLNFLNYRTTVTEQAVLDLGNTTETVHSDYSHLNHSELSI